MNNLDHNPSILTGRDGDDHEGQSSTPTLLLHAWNSSQNPQEITNNIASMDNVSTRSRRHLSDVSITITINNTDQSAPTRHALDPPPPQPMHNNRRLLYLICTVAIVVMYPSLAQITQIKFQDKQSPFETHGFFANMAVVAYTIAVPTSILSSYMKARFDSKITERSSSTRYVYMILKGVFCFSGILAPLSLVFVLLIPHGFNWIGYSVLLILFVIIVACNFVGYKKLLSEKDDVSNLGAVQGDQSLV